ncbi:hypothetical protein BJ085DRAFT_41445 [Dimargaris cristalligena]|uniref:Uncharacterized protein n=1 Tax=Dimargaris cristalligena TaxID=215637 RepID=A0A4P9ZW48_9FUNG|nr:hypothetical protein BJ085DRAFT_41445 [Dimargaris cristalligena]|eukprot:RKP36890.1 hypothetical protein BJ085DRAFT_41445 [Dimargaris cristalligena]
MSNAEAYLVGRLRTLNCPHAHLISWSSFLGEPDDRQRCGPLSSSAVLILHWVVEQIWDEIGDPHGGLANSNRGIHSKASPTDRLKDALRYLGICNPSEIQTLQESHPFENRLEVVHHILDFLGPGVSNPSNESSGEILPNPEFNPGSSRLGMGLEDQTHVHVQLLDTLAAGHLNGLFSTQPGLFSGEWSHIAERPIKSADTKSTELTRTAVLQTYQEMKHSLGQLEALLREAEAQRPPVIEEDPIQLYRELAGLRGQLNILGKEFRQVFAADFETWVANSAVQLENQRKVMLPELGPNIRLLNQRVAQFQAAINNHAVAAQPDSGGVLPNSTDATPSHGRLKQAGEQLRGTIAQLQTQLATLNEGS